MSCCIATQQQHFEARIQQLTLDLDLVMQQRDNAQDGERETRRMAESLQDKLASQQLLFQEEPEYVRQDDWENMYATVKDLMTQLDHSKRKTEIWATEYALLSDGCETALSTQSRQAEAERDGLLVQNLVSGIIQRVLDHRCGLTCILGPQLCDAACSNMPLLTSDQLVDWSDVVS